MENGLTFGNFSELTIESFNGICGVNRAVNAGKF